MKVILYFAILLSAIATPAFAELTDADLDKIRFIVKEEIEPLKADIVQLKVDVARLDGRITGIEGRITGIEGRITGIEKQISHATNVTYGLIALIVVAIGIPAWRGKRDREQERKIEQQIDQLTREIETLKQQRAANPSPDAS